ncbi:MAG: PH domain-containing protein [Muribaculaceae bacterium]|nr:PH domain-containing protein [Muribaculaceae bacterium]MBR5745617.1 PH domain-containing protein [Muribaculaceae bacterium]
MIKIYKSKIDVWILAVIMTVVLCSFLPIIILAFSWALTILAICAAVLPLYFILGTRYIIKESLLIVYCGFIKFGPYSIAKIVKICKTQSIESAPAASLDRIAILFSDKKTLILSPEDKASFVADLQAINPKIITEI